MADIVKLFIAIFLERLLQYVVFRYHEVIKHRFENAQ